ncbi:TolC family outer membrane protein [Pleionea sediminis]|uniref:TolC family outer membrane protein n=1 Tax=Pleionea sediminis TaxID=2569479 RepID=UPI0013DE176E|nr:TolC family outer membrane protein [Pleionea sediminis]
MNKQIKWLSAAGILLSASFQSVFATGLLEVYQQATRNDPKILASEMGLKATEERVNQSFSSLLPQLSGRVFLSQRDSQSVDDDLEPFQNKSETQGYSLQLTQVIYDHSIWKGLKITKKQALKAGVDHEASKQDLIIRVAEAYFNVLSGQDGVEFSSAEMKAIKQELEQTKQKFEVGLIAITDVHEAQARFDQATADNIKAQNTLDNAVEALREITNEYYGKLSPLKDKFALKLPQPANIDEWLKQSEQNNLNFSARKIEKDIARENIKVNFAGHLPTLGLQAEKSDSDTTPDGTNIDIPSEETRISLALSVPIYSGGNTNSKVNEAQHSFQQAVHNMESAYRSAIRQTKSAYLGIEASISSVKALEQSTVSSQAALEATQAGFEVGTRTIVDVLNSTRVLYNAKQNLARARYDYILNTLKLKQAAGTLSEKDIKQVDALLTK